MPAEKVMVGMSGGVDSSVCAALLLGAGCDAAGVTLGLCGDGGFKDAAAVCGKLGIRHYTLDLRERFRQKVMADFAAEYIRGRTPNPCIVCNRLMKFGEMLSFAESLGFDKIATGHYAAVKRAENGRFLLVKAADKAKDQTYVLYSMTQEQLAHAVFPLGGMAKEEVRRTALENGFENASKPDSQDICFVPDGDYAAFIEKFTGAAAEPGDFTDKSGRRLGTHRGIIRYTIGQRKGLGIALGKPVFVTEKDALANRVVLGGEEELFYRRVFVKHPNFIPFDALTGEMPVTAKLRYRHHEQPARIYPFEDGVAVEFEKPQRAPSPGQAAVFYDGDTVVGGGTIEKGID